MSGDGLLPPELPERTRTGWETEHLDDPADDAERFVEAKLPGTDVEATDWRTLAEEYRRERDYWRDRADGLADDLDDLQRRYLGIRREEV